MYAKGLPDNCYELETLRHFRDTWLNGFEEGQAVTKKYYEIAPKIVSAISDTKDSKPIYEMLYKIWLNRALNVLNRESIRKH